MLLPMAVMALLHHERPDGSSHFDWMIQPDGPPTTPLITFRIERRLDDAGLESFRARPLPDHRYVYLSYQGPVSGGRGKVTRLLKLPCEILERSSDTFAVRVDLGQGPRTIAGERRGELFLFLVEDAASSSTSAEQPMPTQPPRGTDPPDEFAGDPFGEEPIPIEDGGADTSDANGGPSKIKPIRQALGGGRHEDDWARTPNVTGTGAIHVKSFHCKLTGDSLELLDQQVNEWLDAHPQYEVKFVTTSVGTWTGKSKEPNLIVNVWV